jgi:hypothetical protein
VSYLISGHSSRKQIESACKAFGWQLSQPGDDFEIRRIQTRVRHRLQALPEGEKHHFDQGPFAAGDWTVTGLERSGSKVEGLFRTSDGYFALLGIIVETKAQR